MPIVGGSHQRRQRNGSANIRHRKWPGALFIVLEPPASGVPVALVIAGNAPACAHFMLSFEASHSCCEFSASKLPTESSVVGAHVRKNENGPARLS